MPVPKNSQARSGLYLPSLSAQSGGIQDWVGIITPFLIGALSFLIVLDIQILDPRNVNWLFSGDPANSYLGWVFYRNSEWTIPLGLIKKFGTGLDTSVVYSDSIPIMAYIFKAIRTEIPQTFQYFGFWYLIVFLAQSFFAWKISKTITNQYWCNVFITTFFTFAPAMLAIMGYWAAESSHFLFLAAIYLLLRGDNRGDSFYWPLLLVLSVSICFYIFLVVAGLWFANLLDKLIIQRCLSIKRFLADALISVLFTGAAAWMAGYFSMLGSNSGMSISSIGNFGYGELGYSFNLLSPFYYEKWSYILKGLPEKFVPNYGHNFLGVGLILGSIFLLIQRRIFAQYAIIFWAKHKFVCLALLLFLIIGLSNNIRVGPIELRIPIPHGLHDLLSIVRASDRLVWPIYYFFMYAIFFIISRSFNSLKMASIIFGGLLLIQIADTSAGWLVIRGISSATSPPYYVDDLKDPLWKLPQVTIRENILRVPLEGKLEEPGEWETFAYYGAKHNMGLNAVGLARENQTKKSELNSKLDLAIKTGNFDPKAIYIISDTHVRPVLRHLNFKQDLFVRVDGYNVLLPGWKACTNCATIDSEKEILPSNYTFPSFGKPFYFNKEGDGGGYLLGIGQAERLGWGWSYPEAWGVWSEGYKAQLSIPYPESTTPNKLSIKVTPFIPKGVNYRVVRVVVNKVMQKELKLASGVSEIQVDLPNPTNKDYVVVEFQLPSNISQADFSASNDTRKLGVGLISASFD